MILSKKSLHLIIFSLWMTCAYSQDNPTDGFTRFYYGNGQVSSEGIIRDGKPDGMWTTYYVNGMLKSQGLRRNFQLDSIWNFYDEKGMLTEQISYKYGKKNGYHIHYQKNNVDTLPPLELSKELFLDNLRQGLSYYYDSSGHLIRIIRYKDGKKQGLMRELINDTLIQVVYSYHNDFLIDREVINQTDAKGVRQGLWRDYYDNDNIRYEANYKDGLLNGYYREYSSSGKLVVSEFYEEGKLIEKDPEKEIQVEIVNRYDDEGNVIASGGFMNNIPVGIHREYKADSEKISIKEYNSSGQIISTGNSNDEGLKEEFWQFFYPGGQVKSEGTFKSDRRSGEWKFYFPDGKLEQTGNYTDGREEGLWTWYYHNGQLRREEIYYRGKEDGLSVEYDEYGNVISKGEYIEGYEEGEWFYHVGDHTEKGAYKGGLRDGIWKYYYTNGVLSFEGGYLQGFANGRHRLYYENGKIKEERYFNMGRRDRTWWLFDEEGNVIITYTYENDNLIKINGVKVNLEVGQ